MKRLISLGLMLMIILGHFGLVVGAGKTPEPLDEAIIIIKDVSTDNKGKIRPGNEFELTITLEVDETIDEDSVYVQLGNSDSFSPKGTGSKQKVISNKVKFNMHYNGGSDTKIPITITYKKDSKMMSTEDYISITNIEPEKESEEEPKDAAPVLAIISSKTTNVEAGKSTYIPLTIRNTSNYDAESISISAELDGESQLNIEGSGSESLRFLDRGRSRDIDFRISVDSNAESKTYPIKINFQFNNSYGTPFTGSDTIYVKVENKNTSPLITVNKLDTIPKVAESGKPTTVKLELKNTGTLEAKEVKVSLNGLSNESFTLASGTNSQYIKSIPGGDKAYVYFEITPSDKLAGGNHSLDLMLNYKDSRNQSHEDSSKFFINVASNKGKTSNLILENLRYPEGALGQNKDFTISFNLKNIGKIDAKNIKVSVESSDLDGVVPKTVSTKKINSLSPGNSQNLSFAFLTGKEAETRNYPINITVEYEDDLLTGEDNYTLTQYVGVFVVKPGDDIKTIPRLIIDKYNFEPSLVKAGENFTMNLSFFNTNSQKTVRNIKIFLASDEKSDPDSPSAGSNIFTPVDSSNTFYIDSIPPKGKVEKSIILSTVPDAQAKTYTITANFEYEDSDGEQYEDTELIGIPVIQQSKIEIGELLIPPEVYVGEPTYLSVEFYNTGKVTLYNMMVKLEGDFQMENANYYIGNFESGGTEYFEGTITPEEPGELTGAIVFTYEDSTGEIVGHREEFTLNVMEPIMEDFPEDMPPMDEARGIKKLLKNKGFWIAIILIAAAGGGFVFYKKRKEKGMALDE